MPLTTTGAHPLPLQMFAHLVRYNEVLHASQQRFASVRFMPRVSIANSDRSIAMISRRCSPPS